MKIQRIRQHYERRVNETRPGYDILDWSSQEAQFIRFEVLLRAMRGALSMESTPRLLDVGCGMADLAGFLAARQCDVVYTGADIAFKVVREALRRDPDRLLLLANVFSAPPFAPGTFDAIFCSGVFNLKLGNNDEFALRAILSLLPLSRGIVVVNLLHRRTPTKYLHCHYFDPDAMVREIESAGVSVEVVDDYLENDFSLVISV